MNDELRHCITCGADKQEFTRLAKKTNYVTMLEHADKLVEDGITTVDEIIRTISITD